MRYKKHRIFVFVILIIILSGIGWLGFYINSDNEEVVSVRHVPVKTTKENLPTYLANQKLIEELPEKANIEISFDEVSYVIENEEVKAGKLEMPDISINVPEKYIERIGEVGICKAISEANKNKEIDFETKLSKTELLIKYRVLLKYRDCLK